MSQVPSVGQTVHYVSHGSADGKYPSVCRAATVTEVNPEEPLQVGLCVTNPTGLFFRPLSEGGCFQSEGAETPGDPECPNRRYHGNPFRYCSCGWVEGALQGGTWHWPERV